MRNRIHRRGLLKLIAASAAGTLLPAITGCEHNEAKPPAAGQPLAAPPALPRGQNFAQAPGEGWGDGWISVGAANLRSEQGLGVLEAGSDIFPNDPRPVVFLADARTLAARMRARIVDAGSAVGLVLRRQSPHSYYLAVYDTDRQLLSIQRRSGFDLETLASALVLPTALPASGGSLTLEFEAQGRDPTALRARLLGADGLAYELTASDAAPELQQPGDAGVLTQADTLLPDSDPLLPALGNLHLLPYGVQEGQAFLETPVGMQFLETVRRRSTARFAEIALESPETPGWTPASVIAATTGAPLTGGATLQVASDLPAEVSLELSRSADFSNARHLPAGPTDAFHAVARDVTGLQPGVVYWRPRLRRKELETTGPTRSFRVLPPPGDRRALSLVYASCGSQFNQIYDRMAERAPDVFIWQGDLNYPDAHGPLAQTMSAYAGVWRHFLDNPRLAAILERCCFAAGRDDHDYGLQDARADTLLPWGVAPWEALMNPRTYHSFAAGLVEVWLLDQRKFKLDPELPDDAGKTLLGAAQRQWLLEGLSRSPAPFKIICSPTTVAPSGVANGRDGSWAAGFTAERDLLLEHIRRNVSGQTIFLSGDTHFTMLWERDGLFEQRACPLDIPPPNDVSISEPLLELDFGSTPGVVYWSRRSHFSFVTVSGEGAQAVMTVELVRDDGVTVHSKRFSAAG